MAMGFAQVGAAAADLVDHYSDLWSTGPLPRDDSEEVEIDG